MKYVTLLISIIFLTACATKPIPTSEAISISPDKQYAFDYAQPKEGTSPLIIKRDKGFAGSACKFKIYLNAKLIADLDTGEKTVMHLPYGTYMVGIISTCFGSGMKEYQTEIIQNKTNVLRVGVGQSFETFISPTAF